MGARSKTMAGKLSLSMDVEMDKSSVVWNRAHVVSSLAAFALGAGALITGYVSPQPEWNSYFAIGFGLAGIAWCITAAANFKSA